MLDTRKFRGSPSVCRTGSLLCLVVLLAWGAGAGPLPELLGDGAWRQASTPGRFEYTRLVMGVRARVVVYAPDEDTASRAAGAVFDRLDGLDAALSDYRVDSELNRLCRAPAGEAFEVSEDLYRVLKRSLELAEASGGAFDPTVGPVVRLWREAREGGGAPGEEELEAARAPVGYRLVHLDSEGRAATLAKGGMQLDLGGIAKGFAAAEGVRVLSRLGHPSCLVALGGDIAVGEPPAGETGWRVRIETGLGDGRTVRIARASVSTSSGAAQFVEIDGVRHSHIVDPRSGRALTRGVGVSVVAEEGATADGLASALSVLGGEAGVDLARRMPGAEAMIVERRGGRLRTWETEGFPRAE